MLWSKAWLLRLGDEVTVNIRGEWMIGKVIAVKPFFVSPTMGHDPPNIICDINIGAMVECSHDRVELLQDWLTFVCCKCEDNWSIQLPKRSLLIYEKDGSLDEEFLKPGVKEQLETGYCGHCMQE